LRVRLLSFLSGVPGFIVLFVFRHPHFSLSNAEDSFFFPFPGSQLLSFSFNSENGNFAIPSPFLKSCCYLLSLTLGQIPLKSATRLFPKGVQVPLFSPRLVPARDYFPFFLFLDKGLFLIFSWERTVGSPLLRRFVFLWLKSFPLLELELPAFSCASKKGPVVLAERFFFFALTTVAYLYFLEAPLD